MRHEKETLNWDIKKETLKGAIKKRIHQKETLNGNTKMRH